MSFHYKRAFDKYHLYFGSALLLLFLTTPIAAQLPSRDLFNVVFENNFEDNKLGSYLHSDYITDWNLPYTSTLHDKEIIDILADNDPVRNKHMRGYFRKGTFGPDQQGFLWYSALQNPCKELYFSYEIRFKPGFEWVMGGKIPGITGGKVTPGSQPGIDDGFSIRPVWKEEGKIVFYVYHQDQTIDYGNIYYWGDFCFNTDKWYNITMRVVLNSISNGNAANDGILEGFIDGKLLFQKKDFKFRSLEEFKIEKMYISSFFGGSSEIWAAIRDEWIDTDNYIAFTYSDKMTNVPRGYELNSSSKTLIHPYLAIDDASWKKSLKASVTTTASVSLNWDTYPVPATCTLERLETGSTAYTTVASLPHGTKTYTDNNLKSGTSYTYRLKAGSSVSASINVSTKSPLIPNAPNGLTSASQTKTSITLKWTDNSGNETGFAIQRSVSAGTGFAQVGSVAANTTTYTDASLQPGTTYYYRVNAVNTDGVSAFTPVLEVATIALQPPAAPTGLLSTAQTKNSITLKWTDNAQNEQGFSVWRAASADGAYTEIAKPAANASSYTDNSLTPSTTYYYKIRAYNADGVSAFTTVLEAATAALQQPAAPTGLLSAVQTKNSITLKWTDNAENEQGFSVWRATSADGEYAEIAKPAANATLFTDNNLAPATTYYYKIRAYNADGTSPFSATLAMVTKALEPPAAPSGLNASHIDYESATLVWKDNATNETGFELIRNPADNNTEIKAVALSAGATSYTDTTLTMNTSYQYRIRAINSDGYSAWSNEISVVTPRILPPAPPTKLKSTKFTEKSISVSWKDNSGNEDAFVITRSLAADPATTVNITISSNDTAFTDSSLVSSTTYQYTIKAVNKGGSSSASNKNVATTLSHAELKRVKEGLVAYYNFGYNPDYIVYDQSGCGDPLNLNILSRSAVRWNKDNTLDILSNTAVVSLEPATKIIQAVKQSGEITFECWLRPKEPVFSMPARIASISAGDEELGFAMDQQLEETADNKELTYHVRMQTASTVSSGYPEFTPNVSQPYINLQHLVYTRNARGMESVYLNGVKSSEGFRPSELDTWKENYYLRLGNESDMNHSWNGSYYSVAIYKRALLADEVSINYGTGPCDSVEMADVDYSINVYPNPAVDKVTLQINPVKVTDNVPHTAICIWNVFGKLVYQESLFNPNESLHKELNLGGLPSGIYFIQVLSGSSQKSAKVILQR